MGPCDSCKALSLLIELKEEWNQSMNQEMTSVDENIKCENAPSKNSEDEAFKRGQISGYTRALEDIIDIVTKMQKY